MKASTKHNNDIQSSIISSLFNALGLHNGRIICNEAGESIGTILSDFISPVSENEPLLYFSTTTLTTRFSLVFSKFLRLTSERVVTGNCEDTDNLNYIQRSFICINQASSEAVAFKTISAFIIGFTSTFIFFGNPLFATFDGINAALYDATAELKKIDRDINNQKFSLVVEYISEHKSLLFEGLNGYLKFKSEPKKFAQEYYGFLKGYLVDKFATTIDQNFFPDLVNMNPNANVNTNINATKITRINVIDELINRTPVPDVNKSDLDFSGLNKEIDEL